MHRTLQRFTSNLIYNMAHDYKIADVVLEEQSCESIKDVSKKRLII